MKEKIPKFKKEAKKIRAKKEGPVTKEQKESSALKEKLDLAVKKLREIIKSFPADGRDRIHAEHTLHSIESALSNLGKNGAPQGKYSVGVEGYPGNPQEPYVQHEGIPVEELIDILKNAVRKLNKNIPTKESLAEMKKKVKDLDEQYKMTVEVTEKAKIYSQLEKAQKSYRKAEELCDLGPSGESKELSDLSNDLYENSQSYFEAHYTAKHGEGGSIWTGEERNKQDLRTRHEAKLISLDYRATGGEEGDYKAAMDVLKHRRELKFIEETEPVPSAQPESTPNVIPTPGPTPEPVPKPELPKNPERLLAVDVSDIAEQLARQRATERLNELLNKKGILNWFSKQRYRVAEEMYRQRFYREELAKIQDQKNVFADPKRQVEHAAEMQAEFQRFQEDLFRTHGGESKKTLEDPEFNTKIAELMRAYATTGMTDEDFSAKKYELLQEINKKHPDSFGPGKLSADNFLEAAREFRKLVEHGEGLARLDAGLKVDLGVAKRVVKTDANLKWIDKLIAKVQENRILSRVLTPTMLAAGFSVGTYLAKKPAYFLGGAIVAGSLFGALRRAKDVKVDVATHRMERAMGRDLSDFGDEKGRRMNREKMEQYLYETRLASELKDSLSASIYEVRSGNLSALTQLVNDISDAEARMSLAETESIDLIQYEGERVLGQSRLELMRIIADAKVQVSDKTTLEKAVADRMAVLLKDVGDVNSEFTKFRVKEAAKAAMIGGIIGGTVGALMQEGLDKIGIHPPDGKEPALERLWHYLRGERGAIETPTDLTQSYAPLNQNNISVRVPQGTSLVESTTGMSSLVDSKTHAMLAENIVFGKNGEISSFQEVAGSGVSLESHLTQSRASDVHEYLQANRGTYADQLQEIHRHGHLMNDTERPDLNELKLHYGGVEGSGYDEHGNVLIDLGGLKQFESFQGGKRPDITELMREGKIKLLITPDTGSQSEGILVDVDAAGKITIPADSTEYVHTLFGKDASGRLTHPGILEAVIAEDDGKFTPIATDPGGDKFVAGMVDGYNHVFRRSVGHDWNVPPFIPFYARKPLEDYKGAGDAKDFGRKVAEPEIKTGAGYFDLPDLTDSIKKFNKKLKTKASTASRGQILEGEKDLGIEYPNKQAFYAPKQIAEMVIYGRAPLLLEDVPFVNSKPTEQALVYLEERVRADKEKYEGAESKTHYAEIISRAYKAVDALMSKYGGEARSQMPAINKIHLSGFYEYYSQGKEHAFTSGGMCFLDSGEIFINMYALERMDPSEVEENLTQTISHEVVHDAVTNNYWGFEAEESEEKIYTSRRSGLMFIKYRGIDKTNTNMPILKERGRALNEAITEELALEAYKSAGGQKELSNRHYMPERRVLKALQEKFKIDFKVFAEAVVNRRKLPELVRAMAKVDKRVDSGYVSMLMAIMDYESSKLGCRDTYPQTMAFIKGTQINLDTTIDDYLGAKFLDKNGYLREEVRKKYNIKTWGQNLGQMAA